MRGRWEIRWDSLKPALPPAGKRRLSSHPPPRKNKLYNQVQVLTENSFRSKLNPLTKCTCSCSKFWVFVYSPWHSIWKTQAYNSSFGGKFNYKFIALRTSRNKLFLTYPGTYKQQSTNCVNSVNPINSFKHIWGIKKSLKAFTKSIIGPISTHYKPQLGCLFYSF